MYKQSSNLKPHKNLFKELPSVVKHNPILHVLQQYCDGTICDSLQFVTAAQFVTT